MLIGTGGNHEIMFQGGAVAIEESVYAGVQVPVSQAGEVGDTQAPECGIVAEEVVCATRLYVDAGGLGWPGTSEGDRKRSLVGACGTDL